MRFRIRIQIVVDKFEYQNNVLFVVLAWTMAHVEQSDNVVVFVFFQVSEICDFSDCAYRQAFFRDLKNNFNLNNFKPVINNR